VVLHLFGRHEHLGHQDSPWVVLQFCVAGGTYSYTKLDSDVMDISGNQDSPVSFGLFTKLSLDLLYRLEIWHTRQPDLRLFLRLPARLHLELAILGQARGGPFSPLMSTFVFSSKHKGALYRALVVEMIDSD
jgi:hypothetical protein